jgi:hypothetical protein
MGVIISVENGRVSISRNSGFGQGCGAIICKNHAVVKRIDAIVGRSDKRFK